jgi:hypothetical protein
VVTGAGYAGSTGELDPLGQLAMIVAWLAVGAAAGFVGRTGWAFGGLWLGSLAGSAVGVANDPAGNILWLDVIVTTVGISLFVTPGFFLGTVFAASRERQAPDGSGRRPTPPPLWTRGARIVRSRPIPPATPAAPASYPASAYARPRPPQPE